MSRKDFAILKSELRAKMEKIVPIEYHRRVEYCIQYGLGGKGLACWHYARGLNPRKPDYFGFVRV